MTRRGTSTPKFSYLFFIYFFVINSLLSQNFLGNPILNKASRKQKHKLISLIFSDQSK